MPEIKEINVEIHEMIDAGTLDEEHDNDANDLSKSIEALH